MGLDSSDIKPSESLRGDIWEVDLEPTRGGEIKKLRPCVIISSDSINRDSETRIVVPLTEWKSSRGNFYWFVEIEPTAQNGLTKKSATNLLQTRCVSIERFRSKKGYVSAEVIEEIVAALAAVVEYR